MEERNVWPDDGVSPPLQEIGCDLSDPVVGDDDERINNRYILEKIIASQSGT
jgi:hypothetical protein